MVQLIFNNIWHMKTSIETLLTPEESDFLFDEHREDFIEAKRSLGNICRAEAKMYWPSALNKLLVGRFDRASSIYEWAIDSDRAASELFAEFQRLRMKADNLMRQRVWGGV